MTVLGVLLALGIYASIVALLGVVAWGIDEHLGHDEERDR